MSSRRLHCHDELNSRVLSAGPLSDARGNGRGGLWLVDAASVDEVEQLVHEEPFWPTGLRKSYSILEWKQVFANGRRLIPSN